MRPSRRIGGMLALGAVFCALIPVALAAPAVGRPSTEAGGQRRQPALGAATAPETGVLFEGTRSQATAKRVRFDFPGTLPAAVLGLLFVARSARIRPMRPVGFHAPSLSGVTLRAPPAYLP